MQHLKLHLTHYTIQNIQFPFRAIEVEDLGGKPKAVIMLIMKSESISLSHSGYETDLISTSI